jgi:hypothetical protein
MPEPELLAVIVDVDGGKRYVVTERSRFRHHVAQGEALYIIPGLTRASAPGLQGEGARAEDLAEAYLATRPTPDVP